MITDTMVNAGAQVLGFRTPESIARYRASLKAALSTLKPEGEQISGEAVERGWQPIETAPKDGTDILAFNCRHMEHPPVVVFWKTNPDVDLVGEEHHWADAATAQGTALYYNGSYFSHWMPLPNPPEPKP